MTIIDDQIKKGNHHIDIYKQLIQRTIDLLRNVYEKNMNNDMKQVLMMWSKLIHFDELSYHLRFCLLSHMIYHFTLAGCDLKQLDGVLLLYS